MMSMDTATFIPTRGLNAGNYRPALLSKLLADFQKVEQFQPAPLARILPWIIPAAGESEVLRDVVDPDVSMYQDDNGTPQGINFVQMKEAGAQGVIIRAGQGTWVDPDFHTNWRAAREAGLPRGAYWFVDPRYDNKAQATLFGSLVTDDRPELDLWADAEYPAAWGGAWAGWRHLYDYLERLKVVTPWAKKSIYTGYYWWFDYIWSQTTTAQLEYFHQFPLALAAYAETPEGIRIPKPWSLPDWWWWQYTDRGNGPLYGAESSRIDLNNFVKGKAVYNQTYGLSDVPPEPTDPPEPGGDMDYVKGTTTAADSVGGLKVRKEPNTSSQILGYLPKGTVVEGWLDNGWIQIVYNGQQAYISADWVTYVIVEPPEPSQGYTLESIMIVAPDGKKYGASEINLDEVP